MAERGASASMLTEMAKSHNQPCHLVQVIFDDVTTYMSDAYKTITYDGHDYTGVGYFLGFTDIEETADIAVSSLTITLSGVDQTFISAFLSKNFIDRQVKIYKAFLNTTTDALISSPLLIFDGRMDSPLIVEDPESGKCEVAVRATSAWVDFERTPGRKTSHAEQQLHYPGDLGMEFASEVIKEIKWGKVHSSNTTHYVYKLR